jgi:hypothetical protein
MHIMIYIFPGHFLNIHRINTFTANIADNVAANEHLYSICARKQL